MNHADGCVKLVIDNRLVLVRCIFADNQNNRSMSIDVIAERRQMDYVPQGLKPILFEGGYRSAEALRRPKPPFKALGCSDRCNGEKVEVVRARSFVDFVPSG